MAATTDKWVTDTNDWLKNLHEEAEKAKLMERIDKKVEEDAEYKEKIDIIDRQIALIDAKRKELVEAKQQVHVEVANRLLKEEGSKYRMKLGTKEDAFKRIFGGL